MEERHSGVSVRTMDVAVAPPANLQPPRRLMRRRRDNQATLIAWLDEQERLLRMRGTPDVVVKEFDPLHNLPEPQGDDVEQGRRTILFRFTENLEGSIADQIQTNIVEHVTRVYEIKMATKILATKGSVLGRRAPWQTQPASQPASQPARQPAGASKEYGFASQARRGLRLVLGAQGVPAGCTWRTLPSLPCPGFALVAPGLHLHLPTPGRTWQHLAGSMQVLPGVGKCKCNPGATRANQGRAKPDISQTSIYTMPPAKELSQADIAEIVALRGVEPAAVVRKRFGIGTSRLYRICKNAEANGQAPVAQAPAANGQGQGQAPAANGSATPDTGQTTLAPAGADAAVLQALGRIEEQMGRLEKQQSLLLEAQEGHYEDVEELEGTVEEIAEAETSILDTLEEGSQKVRTTAENIFAVAKAARDTSLVLAAFGRLGLLLWVLSWKVLGVAPAKVSSPTPTPTPEEESAPAKTPSTVPTPAKVGIREME